MPRRRKQGKEPEEGEEKPFDFKELRRNKKNPMFARGRGGRQRGANHIGHAVGGMEEAERRRVYDMPAIAMTESGAIVQRWEKGGTSHWIVGSKRSFKDKDLKSRKFELLEIRKTANVCYLICREVV
jgi:hypothetical protein